MDSLESGTDSKTSRFVSGTMTLKPANANIVRHADPIIETGHKREPLLKGRKGRGQVEDFRWVSGSQVQPSPETLMDAGPCPGFWEIPLFTNDLSSNLSWSLTEFLFLTQSLSHKPAFALGRVTQGFLFKKTFILMCRVYLDID